MAIRLKTLGASVAPVLLGGAIAFHSGTHLKASSEKFHLLTFLMTLLGAMLLQVGSNLANDYFDFIKGSDTHERKGPTRVMQAGLATPLQMKLAITAVFLAALGVGAYLVFQGGLVILAIGLVSIFCALAYTAGPYPLAYLGLGDIFVFVFFGPLAVCGTVFLQTGLWSSTAFLMSLPMGLLAIAILTVNNVRDYREDQKASKKTVVVRFGERYGRIQYSLCLALCFIFPVIYFVSGAAPTGVLASLLLGFLGFPMVKVMWKSRDPQRLNVLLGETGRFLIVYGVVNAVAWCL